MTEREAVSRIFLIMSVLRRIINALIVHCCINEGNKPRMSINKIVFLCIL